MGRTFPRSSSCAVSVNLYLGFFPRNMIIHALFHSIRNSLETFLPGACAAGPQSDIPFASNNPLLLNLPMVSSVLLSARVLRRTSFDSGRFSCSPYFLKTVSQKWKYWFEGSAHLKSVPPHCHSPQRAVPISPHPHPQWNVTDDLEGTFPV